MRTNMEHWKLKNGALEGLYVVDPKKGYATDKWDRIDQAIQAWTKIHTKEMAEHLLAIEHERQAQLNEHGSNKNKNLRWGASVPISLGQKLKLIEPELFSDKLLFNQFIKKYPIFRVCQIV